MPVVAKFLQIMKAAGNRGTVPVYAPQPDHGTARKFKRWMSKPIARGWLVGEHQEEYHRDDGTAFDHGYTTVPHYLLTSGTLFEPKYNAFGLLCFNPESSWPLNRDSVLAVSLEKLANIVAESDVTVQGPVVVRQSV